MDIRQISQKPNIQAYKMDNKTTPQNLRFCGDPGGFDSGVLYPVIDKGALPLLKPQKGYRGKPRRIIKLKGV